MVASTSDPDREDGGVLYQQQTVLEGLQPAAVYRALVTARNRHGWSEAAGTFTFSTLGASEWTKYSLDSCVSCRQ